jgi:hypothetical protein
VIDGLLEACDPLAELAESLQRLRISGLGTVASVRRINRGASVVIHLTGPAAERALRLGVRELVRVVKKA